MLSVPEGVKVVRDILLKVLRLFYSDHDTNMQPILDPKRYMNVEQYTPEAPRMYVIQEWAAKLEKYGILSSLYMPNFAHGKQINACVKQLLLLFHDLLLWLGNPIPMTVELIASITVLPSSRIDPSPLFKKDQEANIAMQMKEKFVVQRSKRGFVINTINDPTIIFDVKLLTSKLLRKVRLDQCTTREISLTYLCA